MKNKDIAEKMFAAFKDGNVEGAEKMGIALTNKFKVYFSDMKGTFSDFSSRIGVFSPNFEFAKHLMNEGKSGLIAEHPQDVHSVMYKKECRCSFTVTVKNKQYTNTMTARYGIFDDEGFTLLSSVLAPSIKWAKDDVYAMFDEFLNDEISG